MDTYVVTGAFGYSGKYIAKRLLEQGHAVRTLTREEIDGLMADLLCTSSQPAGETRLTDWARENADSLGTRYSSELARRRDRLKSYEEL
jgi:NADH dehydrogenase